jgi:hypothetical protein
MPHPFRCLQRVGRSSLRPNHRASPTNLETTAFRDFQPVIPPALSDDGPAAARFLPRAVYAGGVVLRNARYDAHPRKWPYVAIRSSAYRPLESQLQRLGRVDEGIDLSQAHATANRPSWNRFRLLSAKCHAA